MVKVIANEEYGVKTYVIDTEDDLNNLPKNLNSFGSVAICIATSDVYMLNSSGVWKKI